MERKEALYLGGIFDELFKRTVVLPKKVRKHWASQSSGQPKPMFSVLLSQIPHSLRPVGLVQACLLGAGSWLRLTNI